MIGEIIYGVVNETLRCCYKEKIARNASTIFNHVSPRSKNQIKFATNRILSRRKERKKYRYSPFCRSTRCGLTPRLGSTPTLQRVVSPLYATPLLVASLGRGGRGLSASYSQEGSRRRSGYENTESVSDTLSSLRCLRVGGSGAVPCFVGQLPLANSCPPTPD